MIFEIENKSIFASDNGKGIDKNKDTIVFLHGSGLSHIVWSLSEQFFSNNNFNVLSIDLPGHGNSEGPCLKTIEEIAEWLELVFDTLGLKSLILVGHSQGCLEILEYSHRYLDEDRQNEIKARQGVRYPNTEGVTVLDPETMKEVPKDGKTIGEIMIRGNVVMKGYFKDKEATDKAMKNGWFHSGDLAVMFPDGYVKIQDRSKDIIISGGENISSIEIENTLSKHPSVSIAAVVAKPDEKWGEVPCAFIEMVQDKPVTEKELIDFCKETLAGFKVPKKVVFCELPKTSTGKIQKFELRKKV